MSVSRKPFFITSLVVLALGISAMFFASCAMSSNASAQADNAGSNASSMFSRIEISGEKEVNGIFDPSVEYGKDGAGWMAYSWVNWPQEVVTHIAKTINNGASWSFVQAVNAKSYQDINGKQFVWKHETPTLVYDATDSAAKRWKLYVHRAPALVSSCNAGGCLTIWGASAIWYSYAASPDGNWSAETCLFGKAELGCKIDVNNLDSSLSKNKGYGEMGSLAKDGVIYLSMDSYTTDSALGEWEKRKTILLSSSDHGATWKYVGDLTNYSDAIGAKYRALTAGSLVRKGDKDYFLLAPSGAVSGKNKAHDGTWVIEFEDIAKAKLARDAQGHLVITKKISITKTNGGESDYDEQNTGGGVVFPQLDFSAVLSKGKWLQLYNSHESF